MPATFALGTLLALLGSAAILWKPPRGRDPHRRVGFAGVALLGLGLLLCVLGLLPGLR